jgi:hypothetical protein
MLSRSEADTLIAAVAILERGAKAIKDEGTGATADTLEAYFHGRTAADFDVARREVLNALSSASAHLDDENAAAVLTTEDTDAQAD